MIKYLIGFKRICITEIERETERFVVLRYRGKERRESKEDYFDTFDAAKAEMIRRAEKSVDSAKRALAYAESQMGIVKNISGPTKTSD